MTEEKRNIIDGLKESTKQIIALSTDDVTQTSRLGTENSFSELAEMTASFQGLMRKIEACQFEGYARSVHRGPKRSDRTGS